MSLNTCFEGFRSCKILHEKRTTLKFTIKPPLAFGARVVMRRRDLDRTGTQCYSSESISFWEPTLPMSCGTSIPRDNGNVGFGTRLRASARKCASKLEPRESMAGFLRRSAAVLPHVYNLSSKRAAICITNFQSKRLLHVARQLLAGKVMKSFFSSCFGIVGIAQNYTRSTWKLRLGLNWQDFLVTPKNRVNRAPC